MSALMLNLGFLPGLLADVSVSALGASIVFAAVLAAGFFLLVTVIKNTYVCPPSEVLIFIRCFSATPRARDGAQRDLTIFAPHQRFR